MKSSTTTTTTLQNRGASHCAIEHSARVMSLLVTLSFGLATCGSPQQPARNVGRAPVMEAADRDAASPARSSVPAERARWLCRPDSPNDPCHGDVTATELRADGSLATEPTRADQAISRRVPTDPTPTPQTAGATSSTQRAVDCFYVYPTVDMGMAPANHEDFSDTTAMARATVSQAARFRDVCDLYVPLYRQITIGTYALGREQREPYLRTAYGDVADAFRQYLASAPPARPFVLMGHSQGAEMIVRLVREFIDHGAALRARMVLALAIGAEVETPRGAATGGTFENVALCSRADERSCVIAYRSYREGDNVNPGPWAPSPGHVSACVNPARVGSDDSARFARTYLPTEGRDRGRILRTHGVTTPFLLVRDAYAGRCVEGRNGYRYLAISPATDERDARHDVIPWRHEWLGTALGLHLLDYQFAQGDLIDRVARLGAPGL